jgi:hypothetical protein
MSGSISPSTVSRETLAIRKRFRHESLHDYRQVVNGACKLLSSWTEFGDSTPVRGYASISSAISHF